MPFTLRLRPVGDNAGRGTGVERPTPAPTGPVERGAEEEYNERHDPTDAR
jgi:hypothetical protein